MGKTTQRKDNLMYQSQREFCCTCCGKLLDIGEPFLATATYPARSLMQSVTIDANFLQNHGEVLCNSCANERLGEKSLALLKGASFEKPRIENGQHKTKKV